MGKLIDEVRVFTKTIFYNIKNGVYNLATWFTTIWFDRNYDYQFIYIILHKKLNLILKELLLTESCDCDRILQCVNLINKLTADKYMYEACVDFHKKWGYSSFVKQKDNTYTVEYEKAKTDLEKIICAKELLECTDREQYNRDADRIELFSLLNENIESWWD